MGLINYLLMYICDYMYITSLYMQIIIMWLRQLIYCIPNLGVTCSNGNHRLLAEIFRFAILAVSEDSAVQSSDWCFFFFFSSQHKDVKVQNMKNWAAPSSISSFHFSFIFSWEMYFAYFLCCTLHVILLVIHDKPTTSLVTSSIATDLQAWAPVIFSCRGSEECKVRIQTRNSSDIWINHFKAGKILEHVSSQRILKLQNWSAVSSRGLISIREAFVDVLWWNPAGFPDLIAR